MSEFDSVNTTIANQVTSSILPLENRDRLTHESFGRCYPSMTKQKKA
ncbi:hypothetical protein [Calothrix sp. UHCC 0171]|nr:hypothetical protein [Calothrix sp. UHCC 0171]MEA5572806.1 hypothetical protein [Calothrix sp. UHCC 0171]